MVLENLYTAVSWKKTGSFVVFSMQRINIDNPNFYDFVPKLFHLWRSPHPLPLPFVSWDGGKNILCMTKRNKQGAQHGAFGVLHLLQPSAGTLAVGPSSRDGVRL